MITTTDIIEYLEDILTDVKVTGDINSVIWKGEDKKSAIIQLNGQDVLVPRGSPINIITKALFKDYYDTGFGTYKAQVAIGGISKQEHGILIAGYCFATLYYNENLQVITVDFHESFR